MTFTLFGAVGIGFVWGWLSIRIGAVDPTVRPSLSTVLVLLLATALLAVQVILFANLVALILFLATFTFAAIIHAVWRSQLARAE